MAATTIIITNTNKVWPTQNTPALQASIHRVNQVVNDDHSLSSRLSIPFNIWISVRNQWMYDFLLFIITSLCICRTFVFFIVTEQYIVSRYEISWGLRLWSVWYSNRSNTQPGVEYWPGSQKITLIFYERPRCNLLKVFYLLLVDLLSE